MDVSEEKLREIRGAGGAGGQVGMGVIAAEVASA